MEYKENLMKLKFTGHFQSRMLEREISVDHVKKAILEPDSRENTFGGKMIVTKKIDDKIIEVVYYKNDFIKKEEYIIITAYYYKQKT